MLLLAGQNAGAASITTDQQDYPPFTYVKVTGSGWAPNEIVQMKLDVPMRAA
jgi:hypothetical protein